MTGLTPVTLFPEYMAPYGSEGLFLTKEYAVEIDDPEVPLLLEMHVEVIDGRPECVELRCRPRPGGPPVSGEALRKIPLRRYLRHSTVRYSLRVQQVEGRELVHALGDDDAPLLAHLYEDSQKRPTYPMTDEHLREVVEAYVSGGSKGVVAVRRRFPVSRATASRWVKAARERGLFDEVEGGDDDE